MTDLKPYKIDDNGDYEWIIDPETGDAMSPRKICDLLNRADKVQGLVEALDEVCITRAMINNLKSAVKAGDLSKQLAYIQLEQRTKNIIDKCEEALTEWRKENE